MTDYRETVLNVEVLLKMKPEVAKRCIYKYWLAEVIDADEYYYIKNLIKSQETS